MSLKNYFCWTTTAARKAPIPLQGDEIFASFKRVRDTQQYWKQMQQDMLANIRHFGHYSFFFSRSAADFHWPKLIHIFLKSLSFKIPPLYLVRFIFILMNQ